MMIKWEIYIGRDTLRAPLFLTEFILLIWISDHFIKKLGVCFVKNSDKISIRNYF